jgi:peroxiredoxin
MPGVGDVAPDFSLPATPDGAPLALPSFRGKRHVLLAFFPLAFSPG